MALMIQEDIPAGQLALTELAHRCQDDIQRYQQHGVPNSHSPYGMELFQRAILQHDEGAWSYIYDLYQGVVGSWVRIYAGADGVIRCDYEETATLINSAFARFSRAFRAEHLARCPSVASILQYLKLATRSAVFDEMRQVQIRQGLQETSLDAMRETPAQENSNRYYEMAEQVIGQIWAQEFWQIILSELHNERERLLISLIYVHGMKPAEISDQHQHWFTTAEEVWKLKRRVIERLQGNRRIRAFMHESSSTVSAVHRPECKTGDTPARLAAQEPRQYHEQSEERQQARQGFRAALEDAALLQARQELLRALHQQAAHVVVQQQVIHPPKGAQPPGQQVQKYHLQQAFCGKARCIRCRSGQGHGPYWYAYFTINGKTVRRYVGKTLPSSLQVHTEVAPSDYAR
jgi:hypothetical protein